MNNICDDKSDHVGGKQVITFLDGYATPLECRSGLMYMSILGKPTDQDLDLSDTPTSSIQKHDQQPKTINYRVQSMLIPSRKTFENSTQWAVTSTRFPMRKHFKSRFPDLNIPHRNEAVALCMSYVCYLLNHTSRESLKGQIPLTKLYGVTPDLRIMMMYSFYQSAYYASHNESFPSISEKTCI